jgi:hypothetical protein
MTHAVIYDIGIDENGRVAIARALAERVMVTAAAGRPEPKPTPNTNCVNFCNVKAGCGPVNKRCNPNTVPNCGCKAE